MPDSQRKILPLYLISRKSTYEKIELAVFDMAGTTVNEDNVVYKTVRAALAKSGVEVSLNTVLEFGAGKEKFKPLPIY